MNRVAMKRLLFLLGSAWPASSSLRPCAFVVPISKKLPAKIHKRNSFYRSTELFYRIGATTEEEHQHHTTAELLNEKESQRVGRPRLRLFSAFKRRRRRLRMQTTDTLEDLELQRARTTIPPAPFIFNGTEDNAAWIVQNLETFTPESTGLLDITGSKQATTTSFNTKNRKTVRPSVASNSTMSAVALDPSIITPSRQRGDVGGPLLTRMTRSWFQNFLIERFHRWSKIPPVNLRVAASPQGNVLTNLARGQYRSNVQMSFDKVNFGNICISGGGNVNAKQLVLNMWGFTPQVLKRDVGRFSTQFEFHAHNCTLTESDFFESTCIRNGLGRLLVRILRNAGVRTADVTVTSIDILPSNKISCSGEATSNFGSRVQFEVRSGISTSCRGHVLTFPGLEVTLQPALGVFMPVVPEISLDIGHNARVKRVKINGTQKDVSADASVVITPRIPKLRKKYIQPKDAYLAQFFFDVGEWITDIGNFTK